MKVKRKLLCQLQELYSSTGHVIKNDVNGKESETCKT